jgi:hypothetical protein
MEKYGPNANLHPLTRANWDGFLCEALDHENYIPTNPLFFQT